MKQVVFLTRILTHYRLAFHEAVRDRLLSENVNYRLAYGKPTRSEGAKGDLVTPAWAEPTQTFYLPGEWFVWQNLPPGDPPDLLIVGQESKNLSNYALQIRRALGGQRLAFFGHGRNFQAKNPNGPAERFKRFWVDKVDWWFAYTNRSAAIVCASGFPSERVTVFNNSIDTSAITRELSTISVEDRDALRLAFGGSQNIGLYVGGLYNHKRIPFLLDAARVVRARVPDFQLLVIGGGEEAGLVKDAALSDPWIHAVGPKFGREKTLLASLCKVFLMPGLVGLGVLDSFAYGTPMVTTDLDYHSPEIDYLADGVNGVIVRPSDDVGAYADAVTRILLDEQWRDKLVSAGSVALGTYSIEAMALRFSEGVLKALDS